MKRIAHVTFGDGWEGIIYNDKADWSWDKNPEIKGWYAIEYSWDSREGIFPGADYWDGEWKKDLPVIGFCGPFMREELAERWADDHDVDT